MRDGDLPYWKLPEDDPDFKAAHEMAEELRKACGEHALEIACHLILALERKARGGMYRGRSPLLSL